MATFSFLWITLVVCDRRFKKPAVVFEPHLIAVIFNRTSGVALRGSK